MNAREYRSWFIGVTLAAMLLAATPTIASLVRVPPDPNRFSELWLLGPDHRAENYPSQISINETYGVYVGVRNHLGYSAYYRVLVKLRNQTEPLPATSNSTASSLPPLYEFDFFDANDETWERLMHFSVLGAGLQMGLVPPNGTMILNRMSFEETPVDIHPPTVTLWNQGRNGYYFQLFFELWLYNTTTQGFEFHNRFVGIWLNMTI